MKLFGNTYSKGALRRRIGNMDQVAGVRLSHLQNGRAYPGRAVDMYTGGGLNCTLLADRCLDIASAAYQGQPMGWRSAVGNAAPQYYETGGIHWLRNFAGGLLTTCGLINVGAPSSSAGLLGSGLHGRISNTPAERLSISETWEGDDYILRVSGMMRDAVALGENLTLSREVTSKLGEGRIWIHDTVCNEGFNPTPFMLLYHCNIGWPALDEGSEILIPSRHIAPRDAEAAAGKESWMKAEAPAAGVNEKVYYHDTVADERGDVTVAVANNGFSTDAGFGVYVKYKRENLPRFAQWKLMAEQNYVVGLEPCNCGVEGRETDEQHGLLQVLQPGESRAFELEFGPITSEEQLGLIRSNCQSHTPAFVESYLDFVKPE